METGVVQKNVLLIEDDPTYLKVWKRVIKDLGVKHCWSVVDPEKGAKILKEQRIDLLISDIVLPGKNGYELAKLARENNPKVEILLSTGYQTDLSRFNLGKLRCHLLHKPYHNLNDVCILLDRLLKGKNVFEGVDEESFSENSDHPEITEWTL